MSTSLTTLLRRKPLMISSASSGSSSPRNTRLFSILPFGAPRHREVECRAAVAPSFAPHAPAVSFDDAPHGRQPDAGAVELLACMKALKDAEQLFRVRHVESDAVVAHVHHGLAVHSVLGIDLDARRPARRRELDGVR